MPALGLYEPSTQHHPLCHNQGSCVNDCVSFARAQVQASSIDTMIDHGRNGLSNSSFKYLRPSAVNDSVHEEQFVLPATADHVDRHVHLEAVIDDRYAEDISIDEVSEEQLDGNVLEPRLSILRTDLEDLIGDAQEGCEVSARKKATLRRRMLQTMQYTALMEERMKFIEKQMKELLSKRIESQGSIEVARKTNRSPSDARSISWISSGLIKGWQAGVSESHFKRRAVERPTTHVLTLISGDHTKERSSVRPSNVKHHNIKTNDFDRVCVNSEILLAWMRAELPADSGPQAATKLFLRPYKPFCILGDRLFDHLEELKREYESEQLEITHSAERSIDQIREEIDHFQSLADLLNGPLLGEMEAHRQLRAGKREYVAFLQLWHLFYPGQRVYVKSENEQAFIVLNVRGGRALLRPRDEDDDDDDTDSESNDNGAAKRTKRHRKYSTFVLDCIRLDYDGTGFDHVKRRFFIKSFQGAVKISALDVQPLEHRTVGCDRGQGTLQNLIARGRKFENLCRTDVAHREYVGLALPERKQSDQTSPTREEIDSQVIIDFSHAYLDDHRQPKFGIPQIPEGNPRELPKPVTICSCPKIDCADGDEVVLAAYDDRKYDRAMTQELLKSDESRLQYAISLNDLNDEDRSILPSTVWGYVLRNLNFYLLDVDLVSPVDPTKMTSFKDLVLPPKLRNLVEAVVYAKRTGKAISLSRGQPDIVRGKGRGIIVLLHGEPGTGKSSTAECVAEQLGCPLFSITCGNLGTTATEVERNLRNMFDLAHKWNCVMLLDEADVFLQTRDEKDMTRNAVVSVFLRALEYYRGVLFLTTNKVGKFDEAFVSRIHLSLHYPCLDLDATKKIWMVNLVRTQKLKPHIEFDRAAIGRFVVANFHRESRRGLPWNGRQIRNAFQTAIALAEFDASRHMDEELDPADMSVAKVQLTVDHFQEVEEVYTDFSQYLTQTHGGDTKDRAFRVFDRHDERTQPQRRSRLHSYSGMNSKSQNSLQPFQDDFKEVASHDAFFEDQDFLNSSLPREVTVQKYQPTHRRNSTGKFHIPSYTDRDQHSDHSDAQADPFSRPNTGSSPGGSDDYFMAAIDDASQTSSNRIPRRQTQIHQQHPPATKLQPLGFGQKDFRLYTRNRVPSRSELQQQQQQQRRNSEVL